MRWMHSELQESKCIQWHLQQRRESRQIWTPSESSSCRSFALPTRLRIQVWTRRAWRNVWPSFMHGRQCQSVDQQRIWSEWHVWKMSQWNWSLCCRFQKHRRQCCRSHRRVHVQPQSLSRWSKRGRWEICGPRKILPWLVPVGATPKMTCSWRASPSTTYVVSSAKLRW